MKFTIKHGAAFDTVTPTELHAALKAITVRERSRSRVRDAGTVVLDANGAGTLDVYKVPLGYELQVRRVVFDTGVSIANLVTGTFPLNGPGVGVMYLRSGNRIEFGAPISPISSAGARIPGSQTWGDQQGPVLSNGELFQVAVILGATAANINLTVNLEGILTEGGAFQ